MFLSDDFEQRGRSGYYYRRGVAGAQPYALRECEGCGRPCLVRPKAAGRGRFCSPSCVQAGERGSGWLGDSIGYMGAHRRVYRVRGKASSCVWGCQATRYEWANLTGRLADPGDYAAMCSRCHNRYDAAVKATETGEAAVCRRSKDTRWRPWRAIDRPSRRGPP